MDYSAIILSGGKSSRMGKKKGTLPLGQKNFIEVIRDKFIELEIDDIILSGYNYSCPNTRYVADIFPNMGPLAGIHAGLKNSQHENSIILAEDSPLIPISFIEKLQKAHETNTAKITLAFCNDHLQPLVGIYNKELYLECEKLLKSKKRTIMYLIEKIEYTKVPFNENEILIRGCNTPEEYSKSLHLYSTISL